MVVIVNALTTPQRYGRFLNYQNFLLFFFVKSAFFSFFPVWRYLERVYFFRFSGFMLPAFYCACLRPVFLLSVSGLVCSVRLFWGLGVYNNYISLLKNKSLLVFRFFLAGHLQGHFIGAFSGAFIGAFYNGAFKGHFRLLGAFSCLTWAIIQGQ